jgi:hypothetical protein
MEESYDIQHKNEKEKLKEEYLGRLRLVLGTELSAKNKIQAIGSLAVDRNVVQKEAEKKLKYKSLGMEIQRM